MIVNILGEEEHDYKDYLNYKVTCDDEQNKYVSEAVELGFGLWFFEGSAQLQMTSEHEVYCLEENEGVGEYHQLARKQVNQEVEERESGLLVELRGHYKEQDGVEHKLDT